MNLKNKNLAAQIINPVVIIVIAKYRNAQNFELCEGEQND